MLRIKKFIFTSLLVALAACSQKETPPVAKPRVLVSIAPYQSLIQRVTGDELKVETIVPIGANPHAYEPTARQVAAMQEGSIWFRIGEPFEGKVLRVLDTVTIVDLREGVELIEESHEGKALSCSHCSHDGEDRHIWLSPKTAALQVEKIAGELSKKFPEKREVFEENAKRLQEDLEKLDEEITSLLESVKERAFLVSHPAFSYFCRDYHLEQLSVEFEGKDPRPKHLEELMNKVEALRPELAIALPQHNNKGAQLIAEKMEMPIRMVDPYSPQYFETLLLLAHFIADPHYQND